MPLRSILAATDFSLHGARAVKRAALLANALDARLGVLHVAQSSGSVAAARAKLAALTQSLGQAGGARVESRLAVGPVREEILRSSARGGLLVVGARGGNPLRDAILGSTAERLVQAGRAPILVVKARASRPYRHVVVGFDFSEDSEAALEMALRLAPDANITLVHAYETAFEGLLWRGGVPERQREKLRTRARTEALARMHAVIARLGKRGGRIDKIVGRGYPPRVVLDGAKRRGADLIAVGKQGRSALEELFIGSLTRHILADSRCDVLVSRRG